MGETSEVLQTVSETQIVHAFQRALVAIYPILRELDCIENDEQHYDPFDRIAHTFWDELVLKSLQWKYGLDAQPVLPPYGFSQVPRGPDGYILVETPESKDYRVVRFIGNRSYGPGLFNGIDVVDSTAEEKCVSMEEVISFHWQRRP